MPELDGGPEKITGDALTERFESSLQGASATPGAGVDIFKMVGRETAMALAVPESAGEGFNVSTTAPSPLKPA